MDDPIPNRRAADLFPKQANVAQPLIATVQPSLSPASHNINNQTVLNETTNNFVKKPLKPVDVKKTSSLKVVPIEIATMKTYSLPEIAATEQTPRPGSVESGKSHCSLLSDGSMPDTLAIEYAESKAAFANSASLPKNYSTLPARSSSFKDEGYLSLDKISSRKGSCQTVKRLSDFTVSDYCFSDDPQILATRTMRSFDSFNRIRDSIRRWSYFKESGVIAEDLVPDFTGVLFVKPHMSLVYKKRWGIVEPGILHICKSSKDKSIIKSINLTVCKILPDPSHVNGFILIESEKQTKVYAPSQLEMVQWINTLVRGCTHASQKGPVPLIPIKHADRVTLPDDVDEMVASAASLTLSSINSQTSSLNTKFLHPVKVKRESLTPMSYELLRTQSEMPRSKFTPDVTARVGTWPRIGTVL